MIDMIHICIALIHLQEMGTVTEPLAQGGAPRNDILDLLRTNGISVKGNYTKWRGELAIILIRIAISLDALTGGEAKWMQHFMNVTQ